MIDPIPDEERAREPYPELVRRLSRQSVAKHYDAFADVPWDDPAMRLSPDDARFELAADHPLGATAWYRALPPPARARLGLHLVAGMMKVGVQFENVLSRGLLAFAAAQPNRAPEFRYTYHEVIEESQHSLMFQEFVDRSGVDPDGIGGWRAWVGERVVFLARTFPELFFVFVLGGEDPIDHVQRRALASGRELHPLVKRISQIHITEEARHLCFARQYLREHVAGLPAPRRAAIRALAPLVLSLMARTMMEPPRAIWKTFEVPDAVVDEAYRKNPRHRAQVAESLAKVRALAEELGLVGARSSISGRAWRALGIA